MSKKNLQQLIDERSALDRQLASLRDGILVEVKELVTKFDFSAFELGLVKTQQIKAKKNGPPTFPPKGKPATRPPRYRDPATGNTWSGYGHEPQWLAGRRDEFLIKKEGD